MSDARKVTVATGPVPYQAQMQIGSHSITADVSAAAGGQDTGPSPEELLLASLGACTNMTLHMYASRKQWPLEKVTVHLALNPNGKPEAGKTEITRNIELHGPLDDEQRARLLQIANACPVHKILTGEVQVASALV